MKKAVTVITNVLDVIVPLAMLTLLLASVWIDYRGVERRVDCAAQGGILVDATRPYLSPCAQVVIVSEIPIE